MARHVPLANRQIYCNVLINKKKNEKTKKNKTEENQKEKIKQTKRKKAITTLTKSPSNLSELLFCVVSNVDPKLSKVHLLGDFV